MTTGMPVESPVRGNAHAGFGGRLEETEQPKGRHRASGRPYSWGAFRPTPATPQHAGRGPGPKTHTPDPRQPGRPRGAGPARGFFPPPPPPPPPGRRTQHNKTNTAGQQQENHPHNKPEENTTPSTAPLRKPPALGAGGGRPGAGPPKLKP